MIPRDRLPQLAKVGRNIGERGDSRTRRISHINFSYEKSEVVKVDYIFENGRFASSPS
tara:strand:- start:142 stop:315 length:174 start_codon:yes stop_codon:yes gene_type:complete